MTRNGKEFEEMYDDKKCCCEKPKAKKRKPQGSRGKGSAGKK